MTDFDKATAKLKTSADTLTERLNMQKQRVAELEAAYQKSVETKGADAEETQKLAQKLEAAKTQMQQTEKALSLVNGEIAKQENAWYRLSVQLDGVGEKLQTIGKNVSKAGTEMTTKVTAPIIALGTAAVATFTGFDDSMREVQATMGLVAGSSEEADAQIKLLSDTAKQMGATTRYSASESANALNYLASAGYDAEQAVAAIPYVLKLAQAGGLDLASAADLVTGSMATLGLGMDDLEHYTDELAKTANASNASVSQLGEAILTVGGTAKMLAGGTNELNTVLGILANNGLKGAEGGTHLRNMILSLSAPTDAAAKKMKKLGLEVFDANGNMRPMNDIFTDLSAILGKMTQEQQTEVLNTLFNKTDLTAANALLANSGEYFDELSASIADCDGAAQTMANTMEGGIGGSFRNLESAIEGLAIAFGERLAPHIQAIADKISALASRFAALSPETQDLIIKIALVAAAIGPVLVVVGKVITAVGTIMRVVSPLVSLLGGVNTATGALGAVMTALTGPIGIVLAAVAGLIAVFVTLYNTNEEFRAKIDVLWSSIVAALEPVKEMFRASFEKMKAAMEPVMEKLGQLWETVQDVFLKIWNFLEPVIAAIGLVLGGIVTTVIGVVNGIINAIGPMLEAVISAVDFILNIFGALVAFLHGDFAGAWDLLKAAFASLWDVVVNVFTAIGNYFTGFWEGVTTVFSAFGVNLSALFFGLWDGIKNGVLSAWSAIGTWLSGAWDAIKTAASTAWNGVTSGISSAVDTCKTAIETAWDAATSWLFSTWESVSTTASTVWDGISSSINTAVDTCKSGIETTWTNAKTALSTTWNSIKTTASTTWDGIQSGITTAVDTCRTGVETAWTNAKTALSTTWNTIKTTASTAWNGITSTIDSAVSTGKQNVTSAWNTISSTIAGVWNSLKTTASSAWNTVCSNVSSAITGAKSGIETAWSNISSGIQSVWTSLKSGVSSAWSGITNAVKSAVDSGKSGIVSAWESVKSGVSSTWDKVLDVIKSPISSAQTWLKEKVDYFKGLFDFSWKLPDFKLPKIEVTWKDVGWGVKIPSLSLKWNALGGIFQTPTIFATPNAGLQGVGEAGPEAILPLDTLWDEMSARLKAGMREILTDMQRAERAKQSELARAFTLAMNTSSKPTTPSVTVTQNIYADETSYIGHQREAARNFKQIARAFS